MPDWLLWFLWLLQWSPNFWTVVSSVAETIVSLGIIGALINVGWNIRNNFKQRQQEQEREASQRQRELRGLLQLLHYEIELHGRQWETMERCPDWIIQGVPELLSTTVWEQTRLRLPQLLEEEVFADLAMYYRNLWVLNNARQNLDVRRALGDATDTDSTQEVDEKFKRVVLDSKLPQLQRQYRLVTGHIYERVPWEAFEGTQLPT